MSTGMASFDSTVHTTNLWLKELSDELGCSEEHHDAYHALRAVLHALRDRLPIEEAAALGAQMPMLVRGFYYEGWHPAGKPLKERSREQFLSHIAASYPRGARPDPETVTRAVFDLLGKHLSQGQVEKIKSNLPSEIRQMWC